MKKTIYICMICVCLATSVQAQALVGKVLSQIGEAGYEASMKKHRANQIVDYVARCVIKVDETSLASDGYLVKANNCFNLLEEEAPDGLDGTKFVVSDENVKEEFYTITTPEISSDDIRSNVLKKGFGTFEITEQDKKLVFKIFTRNEAIKRMERKTIKARIEENKGKDETPLILDYVSSCSIAALSRSSIYEHRIGEVSVSFDKNGKKKYIVKNISCVSLLPLEPGPNKMNKTDFIVHASGSSEKTFRITTPVIESKKIRDDLLSHKNIYVSINEMSDNRVEFIFQKEPLESNGDNLKKDGQQPDNNNQNEVSLEKEDVNKIFDYVSRCSVRAQTEGDGYSIKGNSCGFLLQLDDVPGNLNPQDFIVHEANKEDTTFTITTPVIDDDSIRQALIARDSFFVTIKETEDKKVDFIFRK